MLFTGLWLAAPLLIAGPPGEFTPSDTIRMTLAWSTAAATHPLADSIGEISGLAVDSAGVVYASDFAAFRIWVVARNGRSLPAIGRKGDGPGEFQAPTGLGIGPDGRLFVRDIARVSRFGPDPATGRLTNYESSFQGPAMPDWRSKRPSRFDAAGRLYYPDFGTLRRDRTAGYYLRYGSTGKREDSVRVPGFPNSPKSTAWVRTSPSGGRMLAGLNHVPFAPLPTWDVTPRGTLVIGSGATDRIEELAPDGQVGLVLERTMPPVPIPAWLRRDSVAALRARLDSVPVSLDRVEGMPAEVRELRLPESFPPYMAVYSSPDGMIWVRRWPATNPNSSVFDVHSSSGCRWRPLSCRRPLRWSQRQRFPWRRSSRLPSTLRPV